MLIRSQDKKTIVNMCNVARVTIEQIKDSDYRIAAGYIYIGAYSTEEKAINVLDMIQNAYARCESSRVLSTGIIFEVVRKSRNEEQVEDFKNGHRDNFVFQMPQDSEV